MDLASFGAVADQVLALKLPNGDPAADDDGTAISITFFGADTSQFIAARNTLVNETRKLVARDPVLDVVKEQELGIKFLAAITKSWSVMPAFGGKLYCNAKNAERLYIRVPWIRRQVDDFLRDPKRHQVEGAAAGFTDPASDAA